MKKIACSICLFLGITLTFHVLAEPNTNHLIEQKLSAAQDEVKLLKAELQVVKSYQDDLLSTVYWSLGTLATIAVLLIGFSWFANFRIYERDKAALRDELHLELNDELGKLKTLFESHVVDTSRLIPEQIAKEIQDAISTLAASIKASEKNAARDLANLELELREMEHVKWLNQGVYVNALRIANTMLVIALSIGSSWRISKALDALQNDLGIMTKANYSGQIPEADSIATIIKTLDKVGTEHTILVASIKEMLAKVRSRAD
jgi:hypothetical protein